MSKSKSTTVKKRCIILDCNGNKICEELKVGNIGKRFVFRNDGPYTQCYVYEAKDQEDLARELTKPLDKKKKQKNEELMLEFVLRIKRDGFVSASEAYKYDFVNNGGLCDELYFYEKYGFLPSWYGENSKNSYEKYRDRGGKPDSYLYVILDRLVEAKKRSDLIYSCKHMDTLIDSIPDVDQEKKDAMGNEMRYLQTNPDRQTLHDRSIKWFCSLLGNMFTEVSIKKDAKFTPQEQKEIVNILAQRGSKGNRIKDVDVKMEVSRTSVDTFFITAKKINNEGGSQGEEYKDICETAEFLDVKCSDSSDEGIVVADGNYFENHDPKRRLEHLHNIRVFNVKEFMNYIIKRLKDLLGQDVVAERFANYKDGFYLPFLGE